MTEPRLMDKAQSLDQDESAEVYLIDLTNLRSKRSYFEKIITSSELSASYKFKKEEDQLRSIIGRAYLRLIVGERFNKPPTEVAIQFNNYGKPQTQTSNLQFNVSHSANLIAIAASKFIPVGIDIERVNDIEDLDILAQHTFTDAELGQYNSIGAEERLKYFYRVFTAKEAHLKAIGTGHLCDLNQVDSKSFKFFELSLKDGYIGSLVSLGPVNKINYHFY